MDWIIKLIEKHTKDGDIDTENLTKEINTEFPKYAVPKETYNTLAGAKKKLEEDIAERDQQLEDLKKLDIEGFKQQIETLQEENKTAKETYETELKQLQLSNAIKLALSGKVHDEDIAANLIKKDELILSEDGKVVGLDEQIAFLKENKGFLFKEEKQEEGEKGFQKVGNEGSTGGGSNDVETAIAAAFGNIED